MPHFLCSSTSYHCVYPSVPTDVLVLSWQQDAVYFSSGPDIRRLELSSTSQVSISVSGLSHAGAIDYDVLENKIYWIDQEQRAIKSISHPSSDGSQSQTVSTYYNVCTGVHHAHTHSCILLYFLAYPNTVFYYWKFLECFFVINFF